MADNEFKISLVGGLDTTETKRKIEQDLQSDELKDLVLNISKVKLPNKALQTALNEVEGLTLSVSGLNINSQDIQRQAQSIGQQVSNGLNSSTGNSIQKRASNLIKEIEEYLKLNNRLVDFKTTIKDVETSVDGLFTRLNGIASTGNGSIKSVVADWRTLKKEFESVAEIRNQVNLGNTEGGFGQYSTQYDVMIKKLQAFGTENKDAVVQIGKLSEAYDKLKTSTTDTDLAKNVKAFTAQLKEAGNAYRVLNVEGQKVDHIANYNFSQKIEKFMQNNSKAIKVFGVRLQQMQEELKNADSITLKKLKSELITIENEAREAGLLGKSFVDSFKEAKDKFAQWLIASGSIMQVVAKLKAAVVELQQIDTLITEISKANENLSKSDLRNIANNSFDVASKYGKKASDFLLGVQEASRAGYEDAIGIAELSVAAQGAGDMTADLANQYVIATDKAWGFKGSVEELTKVLDGSNFITNHNALNMTDLAEAMSIAGTTAASFGIDVDEATAAMGTMIAVTQQSGSEVARAYRSLLLNIRQVSDEEEGIDAEGLTKYEKACNALNVSLKETKNGVQQLRDPMKVLHELSEEYVKLDETDIRRTDLLNSVGGKVYHVIQKCITRIYLIAGNPLELCTTI